MGKTIDRGPPATHFGKALKDLSEKLGRRNVDIAGDVEKFDPTIDQFQISKYMSSNPKTSWPPEPERRAAFALAYPRWGEPLWDAWRRDHVGRVREPELKHHPSAAPIYERLFSATPPAPADDPDVMVAAARSASATVSAADARVVAHALELLAGRPELARSFAGFMLFVAGAAAVPLPPAAEAPRVALPAP